MFAEFVDQSHTVVEAKYYEDGLWYKAALGISPRVVLPLTLRAGEVVGPDRRLVMYEGYEDEGWHVR